MCWHSLETACSQICLVRKSNVNAVSFDEVKIITRQPNWSSDAEWRREKIFSFTGARLSSHRPKLMHQGVRV